MLLNEKREEEVCLDKIRGSLIGGAAGDALGYAIEFMDEKGIFTRYGEKGIRQYELDPFSGKALISDDTQMTLFTANGILVAETRLLTQGIEALPHRYIKMSYQDWLRTQEISFEASKDVPRGYEHGSISWLCDVPQLYANRAPGNTCLWSLMNQRSGMGPRDDFIDHPQNDSKGCGGIMRVAPLGLKAFSHTPMEKLDREAAEIAAITHGHSLGYMPAAVLVHIIHRLVYGKQEQTLKEIVEEARDAVATLFADDQHVPELKDMIDKAIALSENKEPDLDNIHQLGEGWVAEETLGIAIYCALRHQDDFSAGIIAAVNHRGDSDSTGAVTGNILGALVGYKAIDPKWKTNLELSDVILEMADDIGHGCQMTANGKDTDPVWFRKYVEMRRKATEQ